jgi:voltage-gated potassium channel
MSVGRQPDFHFLRRRAERFLEEPPSVRGALAYVVAITAFIVVVGALLMRVFDTKDFPNVGRSIWWSLQTVTTVGYGDVTPSTVGGRLVAVVVMLEGIALLAIVTAAVTSTFVERASEERRGRSDARWHELEARFEELANRFEAVEEALRSTGPFTPIERCSDPTDRVR